MGFTIINALISQLKADLKLKNDNGTSARIEFKKNNSKGSINSFGG
jgi:two-component sensor histidine kinase